MADRVEIVEHLEDCRRGGDCVECGGCECGAEPSTCTGQGCYSRDEIERDADEAGWEGSSYE